MATIPKVRGAVRRMIEEAAYYKAQRRGFAPGRDLDDWLEAEREIVGDENVPAEKSACAEPRENPAGGSEAKKRAIAP